MKEISRMEELGLLALQVSKGEDEGYVDGAVRGDGEELLGFCKLFFLLDFSGGEIRL